MTETHGNGAQADVEERLTHLGEGLVAATATIEGEAAELAARRPHPDAHLYDVEMGLRHRAKAARQTLDSWYFEPLSDREVAEESTTEKGERNEREAANILGRVYGSGNVDKVSRYSNNDPLRFLDVLAAKDGWPVRFVQVKTNGFTAEDRRKYRMRVGHFPDDVVCEVWVRVDRQGWEIYRFDADEDAWEQVLKMDTCDHEETVEAVREEVGFYDD